LPFFLTGVPLVENIKSFFEYLKNVLTSTIFSIFGISIQYWLVFVVIFTLMFILLFSLRIPFLTKITFPFFVSSIIVAILRALLRGGGT